MGLGKGGGISVGERGSGRREKEGEEGEGLLRRTSHPTLSVLVKASRSQFTSILWWSFGQPVCLCMLLKKIRSVGLQEMLMWPFLVSSYVPYHCLFDNHIISLCCLSQIGGHNVQPNYCYNGLSLTSCCTVMFLLKWQ